MKQKGDELQSFTVTAQAALVFMPSLVGGKG